MFCSENPRQPEQKMFLPDRQGRQKRPAKSGKGHPTHSVELGSQSYL